MKKHNSTVSQREATRSALNTSRNLWKQFSYPAYNSVCQKTPFFWKFTENILGVPA